MTRRVLGISKIDEGKRIYLPKSVMTELNVNIGEYVVMKAKEPFFYIEKAKEGSGVKIDTKQRIYAPASLFQFLKAEIGNNLIFIKEGTGVTISRLENRIK